MNIVLGSENMPKRRAVESAFTKAFPELDVSVICLKTNSGVSSHPISASEALHGAINRVNHAHSKVPHADYYVGIEGGLLQADNRAWEIGWVAIRNAEGVMATGLSAGIEIKGHILQAILGGTELNDVLEDIYGRSNIGNSSGFYGLATDDIVTRQQAYAHGLHFAISQFKHPELY
ncbi:MAG: inosine/xanthosine triphosphatase [Candidatus Saccharimonadales bacterium]